MRPGILVRTFCWACKHCGHTNNFVYKAYQEEYFAPVEKDEIKDFVGEEGHK